MKQDINSKKIEKFKSQFQEAQINIVQQTLASLIQRINFKFIKLRIEDCKINFYRNANGKNINYLIFKIFRNNKFLINLHDLKTVRYQYQKYKEKEEYYNYIYNNDKFNTNINYL